MSVPDVSFNTLPNADGSASYNWLGYKVVGSVNGPIEPQRRDELPEEAFIEVNVRPANGVGGTREKQIESTVHSILRSIIHTKSHPRTLIQVTLQVLRTPDMASSTAPPSQSASHLPLLPHLFHTALLALLAANVPLSKVYTAALCAANSSRNPDEAITVFPGPSDIQTATSVHSMVYASTGEILAIESEGRFDIEELNRASALAETVCTGKNADEVRIKNVSEPLSVWLRKTIAAGLESSSRWREGQ